MTSDVITNVSVVGLTCLSIAIYLNKFVSRYKHRYESNPLCTFTVRFCLFVVFLITFILPIDILLVSIVKNPDGTFKKWATDETLARIEDGVFQTYYTLYGVASSLIFIFIPFLHFFNDESNSSSTGRLHSAIRYTFAFLLLMIVLFVCGAYIYPENLGPSNIFDKITLKGETKFQSALTFVLAIVTTIGLIDVSFYTASGIFSWPIGLLLGTSSLSSRYDCVSDRVDLLRIQIANLRQKSRVEQLSQRDQERLDKAEEELARLDREEALLAGQRHSWTYKLRKVIRPTQIVFGTIFGAVSLIILTTLITVNTDRIMHSNGPKQGYVLLKPTLFNPLEYVFTKLQDYIFFGPMPLLLVVCFLIVATISGIRNLGLWFMLSRLYRIKVGRTQPQALLFFCMTMMFAALSFNLLLYSMAPQYITFGNQKYKSQSTYGNSTVGETKPCTMDDYHKECIITRSSALLMRMMSQVWLFGAIFYWSSWIFVAVGTVSFIAYLYRGKRQAAHDIVESDEEFEE